LPRPPPTPPPFPYTTLFRSPGVVEVLVQRVQLVHRVVAQVVPVVEAGVDASQRRSAGPRLLGAALGLRAVLRTGDGGVAQRRTTDRKSTRLNSSHVSISYAV